jgi:phage/plasmid-associated DNA primase
MSETIIKTEEKVFIKSKKMNSNSQENPKHWLDNIVSFPFPKIEMKLEKGEWKKDPKTPPWKEIVEKRPHKEGWCSAFRTGKMSNITIIDFDNMDVYNEFVNEFPMLTKQPMVKTNKGYHIYFKYCKELQQPKLKQNLHIDVQSDNKVVFAPPSKYQHPEKGLITYEWVSNPNEMELSEVPVELIRRLNPPEIQENKKKPEKPKKDEVEPCCKINVYPESKVGEISNEIDEIINLIIEENKTQGYHYDEWFKLMCACYGAGSSLDLVDQWREIAHNISSSSEKYQESKTNEKFNEGHKFNYTLGTIRHFARESNPDEYRKITMKYIDLEGKVIFEERELRDYFLRMKGDDIFTFQKEPDKFYIWLEDKARWIQDTGNQLKHFIIEQCHILFSENISYWDKQQKTKTTEWKALLQSADGTDETANSISKAEKDMKFAISQYKVICKTKRSFGNSLTNSVFSLIKNKLNTEAHEINVFDEKRELFAFKNICYNLKTKEWFKAKKLDYILTTCNKDWREPTPDEYKTVSDLYDSVFFDPEKRKCMVHMQHAALSGIRHENFLFLTGGGRNGKGLMNENFLYLLGSYGIMANLSLLTKELKVGANQELRNCHKKRFILWSEPESSSGDGSQHLKVNSIKSLTGNEQHDARGLYEKDTDTRIHGTLAIECNKMPKLQGDKDHALISRVIKLDFETTFCDMSDPDQRDMCENAENKCAPYYLPRKNELKYPEFKEKHYCAFFKYITTNAQSLDLYVPKCTRESAIGYLQNEDDFANWFQEQFQLYEGPEQPYKYFLTTKQAYEMYKRSDFMLNATKEEKRKYNEKRFRNDLMTNVLVRKSYREQKKVSNVKIYDYEKNEWRLDKQNSQDGIVGWKGIFKNGEYGEKIDYDENDLCESMQSKAKLEKEKKCNNLNFFD